MFRPPMAKRLAIYGKGGSGKSTVASNLSLAIARRGHRTLQIGCDPKHDSTRALSGTRRARTVIELIQERNGEAGVSRQDYLHVGAESVGCIEAGGPHAGVGCAGLGITAAFRLIESHRVIEDYDVVLMDVLGDVVCGGFAAPLLRGLASAVMIVVAETHTSLYAANNIARAVARYRRNGAVLAGLIVNNAGNPDRLPDVERFARQLSTRILTVVPRDSLFGEAERKMTTVSAHAPDSAIAREFDRLAGQMLELRPDDCPPTTPMDDDTLDEFFRGLHG